MPEDQQEVFCKIRTLFFLARHPHAGKHRKKREELLQDFIATKLTGPYHFVDKGDDFSLRRVYAEEDQDLTFKMDDQAVLQEEPVAPAPPERKLRKNR